VLHCLALPVLSPHSSSIPTMNRPMYRQLYDSFQQAIVDGQLRFGPVLALRQKPEGLVYGLWLWKAGMSQ